MISFVVVQHKRGMEKKDFWLNNSTCRSTSFKTMMGLQSLIRMNYSTTFWGLFAMLLTVILLFKHDLKQTMWPSWLFIFSSAANIDAENVLCLGLSVQRSTFITFDKITGRPFHQLITWQDRRGDKIVRQFNGSLLLKAVNVGASILHFFTRSNRFKQASRLRIENDFVMLSFCNFCTSETWS